MVDDGEGDARAGGAPALAAARLALVAFRVRVRIRARARVRARVRVMVRVRVRVRVTSVPQRVAQPRECLGRRGRRGGHHGNCLLSTETNAAELIVCDKADARGACWVRRRRGKALGSPAPPRGVITR